VTAFASWGAPRGKRTTKDAFVRGGGGEGRPPFSPRGEETGGKRESKRLRIELNLGKGIGAGCKIGATKENSPPGPAKGKEEMARGGGGVKEEGQWKRKKRQRKHPACPQRKRAQKNPHPSVGRRANILAKACL